jgi:hypothetical protein
MNKLAAVDLPSVNERCRTLHAAEECARLDPDPLGDAVGDDLGANDLQSESRGDARRHFHATRTDLPRHGDHSHCRLLLTVLMSIEIMSLHTRPLGRQMWPTTSAHPYAVNRREHS